MKQAVRNRISKYDFPGKARLQARFVRKALKSLPPHLGDEFRKALAKDHKIPRSNLFRKYIKEEEYEFITEMALISLRLTRHSESGGSPSKMSSGVRQAFSAAMARNDLGFFSRVGDALKKKRQIKLLRDISDAGARGLEAFRKLELILIYHWADEKDGLPPFYNLAIKDLYDVCQKRLNQVNLTPFAVENTRQRLGLRTFRKGRLQAV